jgi:predicted kinase
METVILIGIQGSGKSTFYRERFFDTLVRINLDLLSEGICKFIRNLKRIPHP